MAWVRSVDRTADHSGPPPLLTTPPYRTVAGEAKATSSAGIEVPKQRQTHLSVTAVTRGGHLPVSAYPRRGLVAMQVRKGRPPPMSPRKLFVLIRERCRRPPQQSTEEEGAQISRRAAELLAVPTPTQGIEAPSTNACGENASASYCDVGRLHWSWRQQGTYAGHPASDRREF